MFLKGSLIKERKGKRETVFRVMTNPVLKKNPEGMLLIVGRSLRPFRQEEMLKYLLISRRLLHNERILLNSRMRACVGNPRLLEERMWHLSATQHCVGLNISCASLLVLSCKCFCPCWGALVNYSLRLFASASAALRPQTNENWVQNVFLDPSSETFLLRKEPSPGDAVAAACPASSRKD